MSHLRFSSQREEIINILSKKSYHPKASEVYKEVKKNMPRISRATVYRNLETLEKEGIITKIPTEPQRFENLQYNGKHAHFICNKCGKVEDIELKELTEKISKKLNSKDIMINITGTCSTCLKEEKNGRRTNNRKTSTRI